MAVDVLSSLNTNGSGLNIAELSETLSAATIEPRKNLVTDRIDKAELSLSGYDRLRGQLDALHEAIGMMTELDPRQASSDQSSVGVTVTDASLLETQPSTVAVSQLALPQVLEFTGFDAIDAEIGGGDITIDLGAWSSDVPPVFTADAEEMSRTLTMAPGSTLADLATKLNELEGVSARVLDKGDGTFSLGVISDTGTQNALRFSVDAAADPGLAAFDFQADPTAVQVQQATDAQLTLNGIALTRETNQIDDILPGMTMTLNSVTGADATITTKANTESSFQVMQGFVDVMNATYSLLDGLTERGFGDDATAGELAGDALVSGLRRQIDSVLGQAFGVGEGGNVYLSQLGISTQRDGTLYIDEIQFNAAMTKNPAAMESMLRDSLASVDEGVKFEGLPAEGAAAGTYSLSIDPDTGVAKLGDLVLNGTQQADGSTVFEVTLGPLRGVTITVPSGVTETEIQYGHSMVTSVREFLDNTLASGGAMEDRENTLKETVTKENKALDDLDRKAEALRTRYLSRFTTMETIVSQLNSTGEYLTNLIDAWNSDN